MWKVVAVLCSLGGDCTPVNFEKDLTFLHLSECIFYINNNGKIIRNIQNTIHSCEPININDKVCSQLRSHPKSFLSSNDLDKLKYCNEVSSIPLSIRNNE